MLASGNAGSIGGGRGEIPISEIIHHSVRRTSSGAFTSRREPSSKRARDGTFFPPFFSLPPLSFLSSTLDSVVSGISVSRCRLEMQFARCSSAHSKSQRANTLPGLLDSALRSHKTTSHNGSDGRTLAQHPSPIHHPHPTLVSPTGLRQRELRPLRFNLTQHYYVFYHDCSR